jgi:hypothetical protein
VASRLARGAGAIAVFGLAGGVLAACNGSTGTAAVAAAGCGSGMPKLTVQGTGLATGTPNLLTLTLSVNVTTGTSAQAALTLDNQRTAAVIAALKAGGVAAKDIQTTGLSIQANYNTKDVLTGYAVDNSVVAQIREFRTAGTVIDAAAAAAGNAARIFSLDFSIADPRHLQDQARQDAVHQAVSHAATMAAAAGERLGQVCSLTDNTRLSGYGTSAQRLNAGATYSAAKSASPVPLQPGSQQASAQVTIVYSLEAPAPAKGRAG